MTVAGASAIAVVAAVTRSHEALSAVALCCGQTTACIADKPSIAVLPFANIETATRYHGISPDRHGRAQIVTR